MIKFENTEVVGWEAVIRGMRNPMNSWEKSDSFYGRKPLTDIFNPITEEGYLIGPDDHLLMMNLRNAGTDHRKFMRMIVVYVDITAPLYWWKEFDTYKVGTVVNSCSTMHKIHEKEFTLGDFSCEHLCNGALDDLRYLVNRLNNFRDLYNNYDKLSDVERGESTKKDYWWQMIQLLPSSYNQKRTVMMNYEVLANIYKSRKNHKLDEWSEHSCNTTVAKEWGKSVYLGFCDWITTLPYSELITGESLSDIPICNEIMEEAKKRVKVEDE